MALAQPNTAAIVADPQRAIAIQLIDALMEATETRPATLWLDKPYNLYLTRDQADAYLDAMEQPQYVSAFHDPLLGLIRAKADTLILPVSDHVAFLDLGPGRPDKSVPLLNALARAAAECEYIPVDINRTFLDIAAAVVGSSGFRVQPWQTLFEDLHLRLISNTSLDHYQRMIMMGLTFMNYHPDEITALLATLVRPGDSAIVATELFVSADHSERPYRTGAAQRFTFLPLAAIGVPTDAGQYFVRFKRNRVEMGFSMRRSVAVNGLTIPAGTDVVTAVSYRYTAEQFSALLGNHFKVTLFIDDSNTVAIAKLEVADPLHP
jgi:hypothetical protein